MPEITGGFAGSEGTREAADPAAQARNCSFCGLAQIGLELAERHLDRVQVRRVFGQIAKHRTARFDRLAAETAVNSPRPPTGKRRLVTAHTRSGHRRGTVSGASTARLARRQTKVYRQP